MIFDHAEFDGHERVFHVCDDRVGLRAITAIHRSRGGLTAAGGVRFRHYASDADALADVLRLSRAMTYKNVLAGLPLGGAKSVIIGDPRELKSPELLRTFGRFVDSLNGGYMCGPDVGTTAEDMDVISEVTSHVGATNRQMGSSAPPTAVGVFKAIRALAQHLRRTDSLEGVTVAIQGAGAVGRDLARHLTEAGAQIVIADVDAVAANNVAADTGARVVATDQILFQEVDVLSPCALGAVLSEETIPRLRARGVCGAANNQLATASDAERLRARGIRFVPDFVASAGGVIAGTAAAGIYAKEDMPTKLDGIFDRSLEILERAEAEGATSDEIARTMAIELLEAEAAAT